MAGRHARDRSWTGTNGGRDGFYGGGPSGPGGWPPGAAGGGSVDTHEALKMMTFGGATPGCDDHFEKGRPCPSSVYGVSDQYVVLDSAEKREDSQLQRGQFVFNFMVQGVTRDQAIGVRDKLDTVIEIEICQFDIPVLPANAYVLNPAVGGNLGLPILVGNPGPPPIPAGGTAVLDDPHTQLPYGRRVTIQLEELGRQSIPDARDVAHHFELVASGNDTLDRWNLVPVGDCDKYIFTDPIQDIHGLTLIFRDPFERLRFPPDVLYGVRPFAAAGQLLQFNYADPTGLNNLAVGDRIIVRGLSTGNAVLDDWVNRVQGHTVGGAGFIANQQFRLNPDVDVTPLGLVPPVVIPTATRVTIIVVKNRVRIPLRMRRVVPRLTNYIAP